MKIRKMLFVAMMVIMPVFAIAANLNLNSGPEKSDYADRHYTSSYSGDFLSSCINDGVCVPFEMNAGLNDAWYYPDTSGQGFFITVFPDLGYVSLAWFTYDTELPQVGVTANLGDPGHRWLTALGMIDSNQAVMDIDLTSGGIFDTPGDVQHTDPPGSDGTIVLSFDDCMSGTVEYDIPSINRQGSVPIQRVAYDNILVCEALSPPPPVYADVTLADTGAVSSVFGPEGGTLSTTGSDGSQYELTIPAYAVQQATEISMTPIQSLLPASLGDSFHAGLQFGPDGLQFMQALELRITPAGGVDPTTWAWSYQLDGAGFHPVPFIAEGDDVILDIWHFSGSGISINWDEALQNFGDFGVQVAEAIAENALNLALNDISCVDQVCSLNDPGKVIDIFRNWYLSAVRPALINAESNPPLAEPSISQWSKWLDKLNYVKALGMVDLSVLDTLVDESKDLTLSVIKASFLAATLKCDGIGSKEEALLDFAEPLNWIARAQLYGWGTDLPIGDMEKCAALKVSDATYPAGLDDGETGELKVRVGLAFKGTNGWTRYDFLPQVTTTATGISLSPASGTPDEDGWFISTLTKEDSDIANVELTASAEIESFYPTSNTENYEIKPKTNLSLTGKAEPDGSYGDSVTIDPDGQAKIRATLFVDTSPASGKTVSFALDGAGSMNNSSAMTDGNGFAQITFTAPAQPGQSTITATHTTDNANLLEDTITISYGATVQVTPANPTVVAGGTIEITATTTNLAPGSVTWSTTGGASIVSTGDLTANWTAPADAGGYTIIATSVANNDIKGTAVAVVELSAEPTGEFAEGFYYGRRLHDCEYIPSDEPGCQDYIASAGPAWMYIHDDNGQLKVEIYHSGTPACGWNPASSPPWIQCWEPWRYPHFAYRAHYRHWTLPIGSTGSTTTLPAQPPIFDLLECYISCLSNYSFLGNYWSWGGVIRFGVDKVTLIERPEDDISSQKRWLFVKDAERDPFGEWAFDPASLETPPEYRN